MTVVTFNANVDHYVKGDVVDLDADELKRVDAYAKTNAIETPYSKGAKKVSNTAGETTEQAAAKGADKVVAKEEKKPADEAKQVVEGDAADETAEATELEQADGTEAKADEAKQAKK